MGARRLETYGNCFYGTSAVTYIGVIYMDAFPFVVFMWAFLSLSYKDAIYLQIKNLWSRFKGKICLRIIEFLFLGTLAFIIGGFAVAVLFVFLVLLFSYLFDTYLLPFTK